MKIAILTSGILPVPAVQGGTGEILIDYYLKYNDQHRLHDITVYSVWHSDVKKYPILKSNVNHYKYIKVTGWLAKLKKTIYKKRHEKEYYHYTIEYFFDQAMKVILKQHYDIIILENRPGFVLKLKDKTTAKIVYHLHNDILNDSTKYASIIYEAATRFVCLFYVCKDLVKC